MKKGNLTTNEMKNLKEEMQKKNEHFKAWVYRISAVGMCLMYAPRAYAAGTGTASTGEGMWNAFIGILENYVPKAGIMFIVIGAILYGKGQKDDDGRLKSQGVDWAIAGLLVAAVAETLIPKLAF